MRATEPEAAPTAPNIESSAASNRSTAMRSAWLLALSRTASLALGELFQDAHPDLQKAPHVPFEHDRIDETPEWAKRARVVEYVPRDAPVRGRLEKVVVVEARKGASDHRVAKVRGSLEPRDARGETLAHPEVPRLPRDLVVQIEEPMSFAADRPLVGAGRGSDMGIDVPGEVEHDLAWGTNARRQYDFWHQSPSAANVEPLRARSAGPSLFDGSTRRTEDVNATAIARNRSCMGKFDAWRSILAVMLTSALAACSGPGARNGAEAPAATSGAPGLDVEVTARLRTMQVDRVIVVIDGQSFSSAEVHVSKLTAGAHRVDVRVEASYSCGLFGNPRGAVVVRGSRMVDVTEGAHATTRLVLQEGSVLRSLEERMRLDWDLGAPASRDAAGCGLGPTVTVAACEGPDPLAASL